MLHESYKDAAKGYYSQLVASAHDTSKEDGELWGSEDITMNLLPAILISQVSLLEGETTNESTKNGGGYLLAGFMWVIIVETGGGGTFGTGRR